MCSFISCFEGRFEGMFFGKKVNRQKECQTFTIKEKLTLSKLVGKVNLSESKLKEIH